MEAPVPPEPPTLHDYSGFPTPAICLSTYLSDSCYRGRLFDPGTYKFEAFQKFMDSFAADIIRTMTLPPGFDREATRERLLQEMKKCSEDYRKTLESTDIDDRRTVRKTLEKSKTQTESEFDGLVECLRRDDFPPVFWMELWRAREVFADSLRFLLERMRNWFTYTPRRRSQSPHRSKLTQIMMHPYLSLFEEFARGLAILFRTMLFVEIWSCDNEKELFTGKRWSLKNVEESTFEATFMDLRQGVSSLRECYFAISKEKPAVVDLSKPVPLAFRQLVMTAEA